MGRHVEWSSKELNNIEIDQKIAAQNGLRFFDLICLKIVRNFRGSET